MIPFFDDLTQTLDITFTWLFLLADCVASLYIIFYITNALMAFREDRRHTRFSNWTPLTAGHRTLFEICVGLLMLMTGLQTSL